jgi:tRNA G10  N-methylase Trm11
MPLFFFFGLNSDKDHQQPLSNRNRDALARTTLLPSICYLMLRFLRLPSSCLIADPFCGAGSIPIGTTDPRH